MMRAPRGFGFVFLSLTTFAICCVDLSFGDNHLMLSDGNPKESLSYPYKHKYLPRDVLPEEYKIWMKPDLTSKFHLFGNVTIDLKCVHSTKYIILHSKNLNITSYSLSKLDNSSQRVDVFPMKTNLTYEQILFETKENLVSGKKYRLSITYKGQIEEVKARKPTYGFLRLSYKTQKGEKRMTGFSLLAPESARKAFPCFDELGFKAKFLITIVHDKNLTAISNTPLLKQVTRSDLLVESTFHPTINMSTYLIMFAVTDFVNISTTTARGTKINVWGRKEVIQDLHSVLAPAASFVSYYENYTDVNYPYRELNIMGLPQFASDAFEGLGLTVVREVYLKWNNSIEEEGFEFIRVKALPHELSHKWFGGLVTIKQWDQVWLYQGMAQYFQYYALEHYTKSWKADTIVLNSKNNAHVIDAKESSIPLNPRRKIRAEELSIPDRYFILYDKGASMFYMLRKLLGKQAFKEGIRLYMKKHKFGNADADDLWKAFQLTGPSFDVNTVMHDWEYQSGYPLIDIKYVGKDTNGNKIYTASQRRYISGLDPKDPEYQKKYKGITWHVPLWYTVSASPEKINLIWMDKTSVNFTVRSCVTWIKANAGRAGFYRVNYDKEMWEILAKQLNYYPKFFTDTDRHGLLSDAFSFWKEKLLTITIPLKLTSYISREKNFIPIKIAMDSLHEIGQKIRFKPLLFDKFKKYIRSLLARELDFKWGHPGFKSNLYVTTFRMKAEYEEHWTVLKCIDAVNNWIKSGLKTHPHFYLRQTVYKTAVRFGNVTHWEFLHRQLKYLTKSTEDTLEKGKIEAGLAATRSKEIIHKWLNESFTEENANKTKDVLNKLTELSRYSPGRELAWIYFKTNFDKIIERDARINENKTKSFLGLTKYFDEKWQLEEVTLFARSKEKLWSLPATNASLAVIRSNIKWLKRNENLIDDFLTEQVSKLP